MCPPLWLTVAKNRTLQFERYEAGAILLYRRIYYKNNDYRTRTASHKTILAAGSVMFIS